MLESVTLTLLLQVFNEFARYWNWDMITPYYLVILVHIKHWIITLLSNFHFYLWARIELNIPNFTTLTLTVHQALVLDHQTPILFTNILSRRQMIPIFYLFINQKWRALMSRWNFIASHFFERNECDSLLWSKGCNFLPSRAR